MSKEIAAAVVVLQLVACGDNGVGKSDASKDGTVPPTTPAWATQVTT